MQVRLLSTTPCGAASASAQVRTPADCVAPYGYAQANYEGAMASVRMFNLLVADCDCPRILSSFPDREARPLKISVGEHPNGHCD
jgi:hypothetical protein